MRLLLIDYLVNAIWQAPLIALMGWLACNIAPSPPRVRVCIWQVFLLLAVLAPLLPENHVSVGLFNAWKSFTWRAPWGLGLAITHGSERTGAGTSPIWIVIDSAAESRFVLIFFAIFIAAATRLAYAMFATVQLLESARPVELPAGIKASLDLDTQGKTPGFLLCPRLNYPATISWPQSVILLPATFPRLTQAQQRAVLCHEFEHVRRRDFLGNLVIEIVTLPLCWHPAIAFLKRHVGASREFACDAAAALCMGAERYAENLLSAIQVFGGRPGGALERLAPNLRGRAGLVIRIRHLTSRKRSRPAVAGFRLLLSCAFAIVSIGFLSLAPLLPCAPAACHAAHYRNGVWQP